MSKADLTKRTTRVRKAKKDKTIVIASTTIAVDNKKAIADKALVESNKEIAKHVIDCFSKEKRESDLKATIALKALAIEKKKKSSNSANFLASSLMRSNLKINKTAIVELACATACKQITSCTVNQLVFYIEDTLKLKKIHHKRESNNAQRVRNHIKDAMQSLAKVDDNNLVKFTSNFIELARKNKAYQARIADLKKAVLSLDSKTL